MAFVSLFLLPATLAVLAVVVCIVLFGLAAVALGIGGGIAAVNVKNSQIKALLGRLCVIAVLLGVGCLLFITKDGVFFFFLTGIGIFLVSLGGKKVAGRVEHKIGRIVGNIVFVLSISTGIFITLGAGLLLSLGL